MVKPQDIHNWNWYGMPLVNNAGKAHTHTHTEEHYNTPIIELTTWRITNVQRGKLTSRLVSIILQERLLNEGTNETYPVEIVRAQQPSNKLSIKVII